MAAKPRSMRSSESGPTRVDQGDAVGLDDRVGPHAHEVDLVDARRED